MKVIVENKKGTFFIEKIIKCQSCIDQEFKNGVLEINISNYIAIDNEGKKYPLSDYGKQLLKTLGNTTNFP
jgi:hypothetical protein